MFFYSINAARMQQVTAKVISLTRRQRTCIGICEPNEFVMNNNVNSTNIAKKQKAVIAVNPDIKFETIGSIAENMIVIKLTEYNTIVIVVYMRNFNMEQRKMMNIQLEQIQKILVTNKRMKIIIMGDFNATNELWSKAITGWYSQQAGNLIKNLIDNNHLILLNDAKIPTHKAENHQQTTIDLMLTNKKLKTKWTKIINLGPTDHYAIFSYIYIKKTEILKRRILKINNWNLKLTFQRQEIKDIWKKNDTIIKTVLKIKNFPNQNGTWTTQYKNRKKKKTGIKGLYKHLTKAKDSKTHWSLINKYLLPAKTTIDWNNETTNQSKQKWLINFSETKPIFCDQPANIRGGLSRNEMKAIGKMTKWNSSLNADNFNINTWKKFFDMNKNKIIWVIDSIFKYSHIPQCINVLGCGFVIKADNVNVRMVKSPCFIMKIIDKVLKNRILTKIDQIIDYDTQYAFLDGTGRHNMIHDIFTSETWKNKKTDVLIKLDITKAFDTVDTDKALAKMEKVYDESTYHLIKSVIKQRWLIYNDGKTNLYQIERDGVPQGTSIGPLIFIIALQEALTNIKNANIFIKAYADDIIILTNERKKVLQLDLIKNELSKIKLLLNESKTETYSKKEVRKGIKILGESTLGINSFTITGYTQSMIQETKDRFQSFKLNYDFKYLPIETKKILVNSLILPKLSSGEFCSLIDITDEEEIIKRITLFTKRRFMIIKTIEQKNERFSPIIYTLYGYKNPIQNILELIIKLKTEKRIILPRFTTQVKHEILQRIKHKKETYARFTFKSTHDFQIHKYNGNLREKTFGFKVKECNNQYQLQLIALETLLRDLGGDTDFMLTKEMSAFTQGKSNFIKSVILILESHKNGNWRYIEYDGKEIEWIDGVEGNLIEITWNYMRIIKHCKEESERLIKMAWKKHDNLWTTFYPNMKVINKYRFKKLIDIFATSYSRMNLCRHKKTDFKHLILECENHQWNDNMGNGDNWNMDEMSKQDFRKILERGKMITDTTSSS